MAGMRPFPISWFVNRRRRLRQAAADEALVMNRLYALDTMRWATEDIQIEMRAEYRKGNIPEGGLRSSDLDHWPVNVARVIFNSSQEIASRTAKGGDQTLGDVLEVWSDSLPLHLDIALLDRDDQMVISWVTPYRHHTLYLVSKEAFLVASVGQGEPERIRFEDIWQLDGLKDGYLTVQTLIMRLLEKYGEFFSRDAYLISR